MEGPKPGAIVFSGPIPELYDRLMVPLIFEPYAEELSKRIAALAPQDVLEVAAGTGVLTWRLAARLGPDARLVATDLNPAMLDRAKTHGADPRISWQVADGTALPFADSSFDVVACQFGLMLFPDRVAGYREAARVLRPGGRFVASVWDAIGTNVFVDAVERRHGTLFPDDPPSFMSRAPHGYHDIAQIRADAEAGGFRDITIERVKRTARGPSAAEVANAYCLGTPLRADLSARGPDALRRATEAAAEVLEERFGRGPIEGDIQAIVIEATK